MSFDDLTQKLLECAHFSAKPLSEENVKKVIYSVNNLEHLKDVTVLLRYVVGG